MVIARISLWLSLALWALIFAMLLDIAALVIGRGLAGGGWWIW